MSENRMYIKIENLDDFAELVTTAAEAAETIADAVSRFEQAVDRLEACANTIDAIGLMQLSRTKPEEPPDRGTD